MKLAALLGFAILGTSSVAAASPSDYTRDHRDYRGRYDRRPDVGYDSGYGYGYGYGSGSAPATPTWQPLGTVGTGKQTLDGAAFGSQRFDRLMLDVRGPVTLRQAVVRFADGQQQLIRLDNLARQTIDLAGNGRAIRAIIVYSDAGPSGAVTVYGLDSGVAYGDDDINPDLRDRYGWTSLGTVSAGKQILQPPAGARFDELRLAARGRVHLRQVLVRFANGQEQLIKVDRRLGSRNGAFVIDLAGRGREIASLIIYTDDTDRGELTVYAI